MFSHSLYLYLSSGGIAMQPTVDRLAEEKRMNGVVLNVTVLLFDLLKH